jgi:hypothetical protein
MNYTTAQGIMSRGNGELLAHSQPNAYTLSVNEFMAQNTHQPRLGRPERRRQRR